MRFFLLFNFFKKTPVKPLLDTYLKNKATYGQKIICQLLNNNCVTRTKDFKTFYNGFFRQISDENLTFYKNTIYFVTIADLDFSKFVTYDVCYTAATSINVL